MLSMRAMGLAVALLLLALTVDKHPETLKFNTDNEIAATGGGAARRITSNANQKKPKDTNVSVNCVGKWRSHCRNVPASSKSRPQDIHIPALRSVIRGQLFGLKGR